VKSIPMNPFSLQAILAAAMLLGLCLVAPAPAAPIRDPNESALHFDVCPEGCPFARIQAAVAPAIAASSATRAAAVIFIAPGFYEETLTVRPEPGQEVWLVGACRGCVTIRTPSLVSTIDTITTRGVVRLVNLRVLSGLNATLGSAVQAEAAFLNDLRIDNCEIDCMTGSSCISLTGFTFEGNRYRLTNNEVVFNNTGLSLGDPGDYRLTGNVFRVDAARATGSGTMQAVTIGHPEAAAAFIYQVGDKIDLVRPNVATVTVVVAGVRTTNQVGLVEYVGASNLIRVVDNGTSAVGEVAGILMATNNVSATAACYSCDVNVERPNSAGAFSAVRQGSVVANVMTVNGGMYRVGAGAGTDLSQSSSGLLKSSADFVSRLGTLESAVAVVGLDAVAGCTANGFFVDTGGATRELCWCNAGTTQCVALGAGVVD